MGWHRTNQGTEHDSTAAVGTFQFHWLEWECKNFKNLFPHKGYKYFILDPSTQIQTQQIHH